MDTARKDASPIKAHLGLWDAVSLIVGIIIGVGIFRTPVSVFEIVPDVVTGLGVWVVAGLLAFVGALCFAELATAYPRSGGEYVYLSKAFGPAVGFLFAWAQLTLIRPGSIAALAYIFADYATKTLGLAGGTTFAVAGLAVGVLTIVNVLGVTLGTLTQKVLTVAKVAGLAAIVVVGFWVGTPVNLVNDYPQPVAGPLDLVTGYATVMMFVFWTYSGWHESAYVVSEIKDNPRNIPRSLLLGTGAVVAIYLVINTAYLYGLGFSAFYGVNSHFFVAELLEMALGEFGSTAIAILIMVSALGAINGMIFTTARIYSEFGVDHRLFAPLSHWSRRYGTPARALVVQALITAALMGGVAWVEGNEDSFDAMLGITSAVFWGFFLLTGIAFFVLRVTDADRPRPFVVPMYPWLPLLFCATCAFMMAGIVLAQPRQSLAGLVLLAAGLPFYFWPRGTTRPPAAKVREPVPHELVS